MEIKKTDCGNNRDHLGFIEETLTNAPGFKSISMFEGIGGLASLPFRCDQDSCCGPYKNKKELFEALDSLNDNNIESEDFGENEKEKVLYRMFSSDYSCDFKINGIATDVFGRQFVIVCLDDNQYTPAEATIDSDGMLKSKENPEEYKDLFSKERKITKDKLRALLKNIAILNSDINDLSIHHETTYDEHMRNKQEVEELKEKVWILYNNSLSKGELFNDTQSETRLPLTDSLDTKRAHTYFQKAIDKGLLKLENGKFSWIQIGNRGGKSQLAYFCGKVYGYKHSINGNVGTSFPEEKLNELFGIKKMQSLLQQVYEAKNEQSWRQKIDELFE